MGLQEMTKMTYYVLDSSRHPLIPTPVCKIIFYMESIQYLIQLRIPSKSRYLVSDLDYRKEN